MISTQKRKIMVSLITIVYVGPKIPEYNKTPLVKEEICVVSVTALCFIYHSISQFRYLYNQFIFKSLNLHYIACAWRCWKCMYRWITGSFLIYNTAPTLHIFQEWIMNFCNGIWKSSIIFLYTWVIYRKWTKYYTLLFVFSQAEESRCDSAIKALGLSLLQNS